MFKVFRKELDWAGRKLVLETGKIARQADGAVLATYGGTTVLATVVFEKRPKPGLDFFPLTVNYQEKAFAAGKIPGGFFKREGRPSEKEVLTSRLIDRPIRPLFHESYKNETLVVVTTLAHDMENDPDIVSMVATSAALTISGVPFMGPIGAARVARIDGQLVINPTLEQTEKSELDLVVAGTQEGVLMVESEAKELPEDVMLQAVMEGHRSFQPVIDAVIQLAEHCAKDPMALPEPSIASKAVGDRLKEEMRGKLAEAYTETQKLVRQSKVAAVKADAKKLFEGNDEAVAAFDEQFGNLEAEVVRSAILDTGKRIDGRDTRTVRPIVAEVGVLPRAHGSSLFTRGETQALVVATLGTGQDEQIIDALEGEYREHFMMHYNMPPYAVGEVRRMGSPGRREIGHGKLAWRALRPMMPSKDKFPYTIRIVSEITESNGSSSMASVCGGSLSLMDAGVPIDRPVAGIAMGLIKEGERFAVLSDILGDEDHLGDMDFKVAGTEHGITSLQMDLKITSINEEIMRVALGQAKDGRIHILGEMAKGLGGARDTVSQNAPRITQFTIPKDKIREVIGTGGKVIREITETTGTKIDIEDDGTIKVAAVDAKAGQAAIDWIKGIVAEPEVGVIYNGKVVKTVEFGAFVNFLGARDGLVHISELAPRRVAKVTDVVKEGDQVKVKVLGVDDRGKVRLSMKAVDQQTGEDISQRPREEPAPAVGA
ncbi:MAG: polyribonucleotide nucleotidyltransferase [Alphaproteobacteria bacterium]|nr:polyribonucleotide nucleotidyltransferase [Alphaproteobacteria bacterium]MBV8409069.1 polyribonucleotide nucleotidyltransferase [Alphaproteobacteria bacterium]